MRGLLAAPHGLLTILQVRAGSGWAALQPRSTYSLATTSFLCLAGVTGSMADIITSHTVGPTDYQGKNIG